MGVKNFCFWLTKRYSYDAIAEDFSQTRFREWPEFEVFQSDLCGNILDVGCGNGRLFSFLAREKSSRFSRYTGLDSSKKMLDCARKKYASENFVAGKMTRLPFQNHTFDTIAAIASVAHLPSFRTRQKAFSEFFRALIPGGSLVITTWNLFQNAFFSQQKEAAARAKKYFWWGERDYIIPFGVEKIPRFYHAFSPDELRDFLSNAGFVEIEIFSVVNGKRAAPLAGKNICAIAKKPLRVSLLGVPFDALSRDDALKKMHQMAKNSEQKRITTPNPEMVLAAQKDAHFLKILQNADLSFADGKGILWGIDYLHFQRRKWFIDFFRFFFSQTSVFLPQTVCGSDVFKIFCTVSSEKIFLLGGAPKAAKKCAEIFDAVTEWDDGWATVEDERRICKKINASGATVLFVAFGAPKQEKWIARNLKKIPNIHLAVGVGGSFDFVSGAQKRAPKWVQKIGEEWAWRLFLQPRRAERIWRAVMGFGAKVGKSSTK